MRAAALRPAILAGSVAPLLALILQPAALAGSPAAHGRPGPTLRVGPAAPPRTAWVKRFPNGGATSLAVSADGAEVFVTGQSDGPRGNTDATTIAYNAATGAKLWRALYNGPGNGFDYAASIGLSPNGAEVFVTGASAGRKTDEDYTTIAYNASDGAVLWVERYNGPVNRADQAISLGVSPDGSAVFVTGTSTGRDSGCGFGDAPRLSGSSLRGSQPCMDYATLAYDALTGRLIWVKRYDGPTGNDDSATALGIAPDGTKVFVTGQSLLDPSHSVYATVAYDAHTGATLGVMRYMAPDDLNSATALRVSPDASEVFVTGESGSQTGSDYATAAYDTSSGALLWAKRYDGPQHLDDRPTSLGVAADGSKVFVTGESGTSTRGYDYATVAYDARTGATLWVRRYDDPVHRDDQGTSLGTSPDSNQVFVTGESFNHSSRFDYVTIAYDTATGARLWTKRYNGPGNLDDVPTSLGVGPTGEILITGASPGQRSESDFATVAYAVG